MNQARKEESQEVGESGKEGGFTLQSNKGDFFGKRREVSYDIQ